MGGGGGGGGGGVGGYRKCIIYVEFYLKISPLLLTTLISCGYDFKLQDLSKTSNGNTFGYTCSDVK